MHLIRRLLGCMAVDNKLSCVDGILGLQEKWMGRAQDMAHLELLVSLFFVLSLFKLYTNDYCRYKLNYKRRWETTTMTTTTNGVLYCAPPFLGGIAGIRVESRRLVGIWWEYFLGESPPKFHLDWE